MKDAAALAARGEPHGTVVVAEEQTAGIGRHGHKWYSEYGGGLYLSIILRPSLTADALPVLTMALGLAAHSAVEDAAGVTCDLRWPNDLLLNGRKLAGTMVQSTESALIAGVGINVNQPVFPPDLRELATSLYIETRREHSKEALLDRAVEQALAYTKLLEDRGREEIFRRFEAHSSYVLGKAVEVAMSDRTVEGVTAGLDENGFLRVQTPAGIETIVAGGVRERAAPQRIAISGYDPRWIEFYRREESNLRGILGGKALRIEHTGSTSVPGLAAKPVIDILLVVADSSDEADYVPALERAGYVLRIREPEWFEHRMFKGGRTGNVTDINLHVFTNGCPEIDRVLLFRDWLRRDQADRELYRRVKLALAEKEWKSVDEYAAAKTAVISEIMERALASRARVRKKASP
jgi:biotin-[acetyl-CoA-carboxylase] ligase BirA-like protein